MSDRTSDKAAFCLHPPWPIPSPPQGLTRLVFCCRRLVYLAVLSIELPEEMASTSGPHWPSDSSCILCFLKVSLPKHLIQKSVARETNLKINTCLLRLWQMNCTCESFGAAPGPGSRHQWLAVVILGWQVLHQLIALSSQSISSSSSLRKKVIS